MRSKPEFCLSCPLHNDSGFVADRWDENVKIGVLKRNPTKEEIRENRCLGGNAEERWIKDFLGDIPVEAIGIAHVLRCGFTKDEIPVSLRKTLNICRYYDDMSASSSGTLEKKDSLLSFDPNCFIITYDSREVSRKAAAYKIFIRRAFDLAKTLAYGGNRPLILMGEDAAKLVYPQLFEQHGSHPRETSFKSWVGHYWFGSWPFRKKGEEKAKTEDLVQIEERARRELMRLF